MSQRLPFDYNVRLDNLHFIDAPADTVHQHQVYEFLRYLVQRGGFRRVIDIGCGSAEKLKDLDETVEVTCVDAAPMREFVARNMPRAEFIEWDLDDGLPELGCYALNAIVVCADVIEHLRRPERLLGDLARLSCDCAYVLISTPDRVRARGLMDVGPPRNPAHTMEWTADELGRFLRDCGFPEGFYLGYTLNNNVALSKKTILAIAGREATFTRPDRPKSVAAIINVFNEYDILEQVVRYLKDQGVQVHIVDNWSTDGSYEIARTMLAQDVCSNVIRFPAETPADYDLMGLLQHTAEYGAKLQSDWIIHYDADEFRCAPWPSTTLAEAISFVDGLGYSAIDFTILNFGFTDSDEQVPFSPGARRFFDFGRHPAHQVQIKAWKNQGQVADLGSSGGHTAAFTGSRIFPLKFLTRHYPLRSSKQASTKIFRDRLPRIEREHRELGWHNHYDTFRQVASIQPWRRSELLIFDPVVFGMEFLVERLSGIGIETDDRAIPNIHTIFEWLEASKLTEAQLRQQTEDAIRMANGVEARASTQIEELERDNLMLRAEVAALRRSSSWRITAPIRGLKGSLMRAFNRNG